MNLNSEFLKGTKVICIGFNPNSIVLVKVGDIEKASDEDLAVGQI